MAGKGFSVSGDTIDRRVWVETRPTRIKGMGLSSLTFAILELARAFGCLGSQILFLIQPFVSDIVSDATLSRTAEMLEDPGVHEQLAEYLESKENRIEL